MSEKDASIYVIGSSNMDLITTANRIPVAGETVIGNTFSMRCGGKGANQAVAIAKLCQNPSAMHFVSTIGDDANGREVYATLKKNGVNVDDVMILPGETTGMASICIDQKGENSIIVVPGANALFSIDRFNSIHLSPNCRVVVLQQEIPLPTIKHILRVCHARGIVTILNPAPASAELTLKDEEFGLADIVIPNETEAQWIAGNMRGGQGEGDMDMEEEKIRTTLVSSHPQQIVVMTRGKRGAVVCRGQEIREVECPTVHVQDTVGAGDCFVGTFAYLLNKLLATTSDLKRISLDEIARIARMSCNASSYSVQFKGGFEKYPSEIIESWEENQA